VGGGCPWSFVARTPPYESSDRQLVLTRHDLHQLLAKTDTRPDHTPRRLTLPNTCANTCARSERTRPLFPKSSWKVSTGADDCVSSGARAARSCVGRLLPPRERERRVSRLTPGHRETSPGGSYGTPGAGAPRRAPACRRIARKGFRFRDLSAASAMAVRSLGPPTTMSFRLAIGH
jgi:hypothetical protein